MAKKTHYQIKVHGFNHDGQPHEFDDVIALSDGQAAQHVAVGAVVETHLPLTEIVVPTDEDVQAAQDASDAEALALAKKTAAASKSHGKKK